MCTSQLNGFDLVIMTLFVHHNIVFVFLDMSFNRETSLLLAEEITSQKENLAIIVRFIEASDAGDDGDVRNNTDTYTTTGVVQQIVSLDSTEYAAIATKDPNTLYVVIHQTQILQLHKI